MIFTHAHHDYPFHMSPSSSSSSNLPHSAHTASSLNDPQKYSDSLPPRMRLKEKKKPFGQFRIIREPHDHHNHTTEEPKPIPSPPWANDSFSLDRRTHSNDTPGTGTSHVYTAPPFRLERQARCTPSTNNSKSSSTECSTTGTSLQALSISSAYTWTPSIRSALPSSSFLSTSGSSAIDSAIHYQTDDASSDAGLSIAHQLRSHRTIKPRTGSTHTLVSSSIHAAKEEQARRAQSLPDEDDEEMASMATTELQHFGTEANSFPPPARPSRKHKRHTCDVCGQIFTRSGDVRRHKETRHDNTQGCRCPFCDRVLTRQDALQRHWDKYCRKKSKRHLDKQTAETQTQNPTFPSMSTPAIYTSTSSAQTTSTTTTVNTTTATKPTGIGTGMDQTQINYRYLNIFG